MTPTPAMAPAARELIITRVLNAPRDLVFKMWLDPKYVMQWWGPKHHPATQITWDARPGGKWRNCLRSVETGQELWHHGVFHEVVPPERLVFSFVWEEDGERGIETMVTISLADQGAKTLLTLHQAPFQSAGEQDGHGEGWGSTFDRLADHLQTMS